MLKQFTVVLIITIFYRDGVTLDNKEKAMNKRSSIRFDNAILTEQKTPKTARHKGKTRKSNRRKDGCHE